MSGGKPLQRLLTSVSIAVGLLMGLTGLGFIAMYLYSAVVERLGDPDQSLLFWLLPILLAGIGLTFAGTLLLRLGFRRKRTDRATRSMPPTREFD
jgi:hypothetical protein